MRLGLMSAAFPQLSLDGLAARAAGNVINIQHEDRAFEKTEELVKRGFLLARDALKLFVH